MIEKELQIVRLTDMQKIKARIIIDLTDRQRLTQEDCMQLSKQSVNSSSLFKAKEKTAYPDPTE